MTLYLTAGKRRVPVQVNSEGRRLSLRFRFDRALVNEVKSMRGAAWKGDHWVVTDCERNWIQLELLQGKMPRALERYHNPQPVNASPKADLWPWQRGMLQHILSKRRVILAADMGTGKTLATIEAMRHVGGRWLWVTLAGIIPSTEIEFEKWGAPAPRFVSYDKLRSLDPEAYTGVVFDESSTGGLKTTGKTWRAACKAAHEATYVVCMTGTPAPLCPLDWWPQCELVAPGFLREGTLNAFEKRLAILGPQQDLGDGKVFRPRVGWKEDELEALARRLKPLVYTCFAHEVQDLPEPEHEVIDLEPTDETLRLAWLAVEHSATTVEALGKLRQLSDGFLYGDETSRRETPKDSALTRLIADENRVSVYASFRESIDRVSEVCAAAGFEVITRDGRGYRTLRDGKWRAVKDPKPYLRRLDRTTDPGGGRLAYVANALSGGVGLNLTACPVAVFYSCDWNYGARSQALKRSHRPGMKDLRIYDLCHLPTDRKILANYRKKAWNQAQTLGDEFTLEELRRDYATGDVWGG